MKTIFLYWGYVACLLFSVPFQQRWSEKISVFQIRLANEPTQANYDSLHQLITDHYQQLSLAERATIRKTLETSARWPTGKLCFETEPGIPITIRGHVLDEHRRPISNARLHLFQADYAGYYAPSDRTTKKMSEQDPRLCTFLAADKLGRYGFQTIQPGSYPIKYEGRLIPQHIHLNVTATGYQMKAIQLTFDNDPAMNDSHWRDWARNLHFPVIVLKKEQGGQLAGDYEVILSRIN